MAAGYLAPMATDHSAKSPTRQHPPTHVIWLKAASWMTKRRSCIGLSLCSEPPVNQRELWLGLKAKADNTVSVLVVKFLKLMRIKSHEPASAE